jgi:SanA protein
MENRNIPRKTTRRRKYIWIGLMIASLWGVAYGVWLYCYWFVFLPGTEPSFFLTFLVFPAFGVVYYLAIRLRSPRLNSFKRSVFLLLSIGLAVVLLSRFFVLIKTRSMIFSVEEAPAKRVTIVFGGGLNYNGTLTPEIASRVETAVDLYFDGKTEKLLMSGDNRFVNYNEPAAMREYAIQLGVPDTAITLDYAGRRTYDTCYRAGYIFELKEAILVTQQYHLPRSLYICDRLGIKVAGVPASRTYLYLYGNLREFLAVIAMLWDVHVSHPLPVLGIPEPIY